VELEGEAERHGCYVPQAFLFAHNEEDDHYPNLRGRLHNVQMFYVYGSVQHIDPYPNTINNLFKDYHTLNYERVPNDLDRCCV
jgi:hypothetical protein